VNLPNTPEVVELSSDDELMEGLEDHLEIEEDPEEDPDLWEITMLIMEGWRHQTPVLTQARSLSMSLA